MTAKQWLEKVASNDTCEKLDDAKMQNLLCKVGFPEAVCLYGITYLEGRGTLESPPMPIQSVAKMLLQQEQR